MYAIPTYILSLSDRFNQLPGNYGAASWATRPLLCHAVLLLRLSKTAEVPISQRTEDGGAQ